MQTRTTGLSVILAAGWFVASASAAHAQPSSATDVPERLVLEAGGFNLFLSTNLTVNSLTLGGTTVNFERELGLPDTAQRGYVEGFWSVARRHQLSVNYEHLNRTGSGVFADARH
jgi:hypothetical protein